MATLSMKKEALPFLLAGNGELTIDTATLRVDRRIPRAPRRSFASGSRAMVRIGSSSARPRR